MDRIMYANGDLLTGTDIATTLLDYAEALPKKATSATVSIPVREADGSLSRASFLLGPASQIVTENVESDFDEVIDLGLVTALRAEIARLTGAPVSIADQPAFDGTTEHGFEYPDDTL